MKNSGVDRHVGGGVGGARIGSPETQTDPSRAALQLCTLRDVTARVFL